MYYIAICYHGTLGMKNRFLFVLCLLYSFHSNADNPQQEKVMITGTGKGIWQSIATFFTMEDAKRVPDQLLTPPLPAKPGKTIITPEWVLDLPKFTGNYPSIRWLNNTQLIYVVPPTRDQLDWTIELLDLPTGKRRMLGIGADAKPSPDQKWIAFTHGEKEAKQVWVMRSDGTDRKQISHVQGGTYDYISFEFEWSPDSKFIALVQQPGFAYWEKKKPLASAVEMIDVGTGLSKKIASFEGTIWDLSWLPNGEELLFMNVHNGPYYNEEKDWTQIQTLNINTGQVRTLAKFEGLQQLLMPRSSPDGKFVAFMYDADNPIFNHMPSLGIVPNEPISTNTLPPIRRITHELKLFSPRWSHDSQHVYVRRDYGAYRQIYSIDIKTGEAQQITNAALDVKGYAVSPDGSQLAWTGLDAQSSSIVRVADSDGQNARDLVTIPGVPQDVALSEVREIDWQVPSYPNRMRGLLFMPLNYQKNTQYPLIVDIHGGGAGASINMLVAGGILVSTPLEWHMWAAKGYAVFVPEFRSSASFGSLAISRDDHKNHDLINCDIKDIEAGIDELIKQNLVDSKSIAVIGHSAGARRVNWLLTTNHRFRSAISKEGWADDWISCMHEQESSSKRISAIYGGTPWEVPENYLKNSALYHGKGVTIPTLFLMGNAELGGIDTHGTTKMLYNVIKAQGIEVGYVKYPDEGHVFEKPENRRDALMRTIKWIDSHMK